MKREKKLIVNELVLGPKVVGEQTTAGKTGQIGISGATLVYYDGSAWKTVATTN